MNKWTDRAQTWARFLLLPLVVVLAPRAWGLFDLQENWGFDQGGGYRQGNFVGEDASLVLVDQAWDEQRKLLAVGGAQGDEWAVRVYEVGPNGPNLLMGWTGASDPRLEFSTITSLAWNSTNGSLLCAVEHTLGGRSQAGLLLLDLSEANATQLIELEGWDTVVGVEESIITTGEFWVLGEGDGGGLCRSVNPSIPEESADNEFMLHEILRPQAMCQIEDQLWVVGKAELKKSFIEVYQGNEQVGAGSVNDERFVSAMVSDGKLVYLTGREKQGNDDEMENLFLETFELKGKSAKLVWSATSESFIQDGSVGRAGMGREVGTSLMPLTGGGVLIGGYHQQYWKLGGQRSQMLAMLPPDLDGKENFESFVARFDQDGKLLWAQSSGFRGNDFPLGLTPGGQEHTFLLGNRKLSRGFGPFLEKLKITGNDQINAPLVALSAQGLNKLLRITWNPQSTLRFGEAVDSRHLSATAPGGTNFVYELNGTSIVEGDFPLFEPGQLELTTRLLDDSGSELNATTQQIKGLKGRPFIKLLHEEVAGGIQFSAHLSNLHPEHMAEGASVRQELVKNIKIEPAGDSSLQIDSDGFLPLSADLNARLEVVATFMEHELYEGTSATVLLQIRNGKIGKPGDESMVRVQVRDLDGWQKEKFVQAGTEAFISAVQGFGRNRKFKRWVEFSDADQKLRTARVQSPFKIRTAIFAQADMTLFAHYNFTFLGTAINGYLGGSTVFLDFNLNGQFDDGEPSGFTTTNGGYEIEVSEEEMLANDKNTNGVLDPSEGMIVVMGGIDHSSNLPLAISYRAPPSYSVITAVSTLVAEFTEEGLTLQEAEEVVSIYLGLPSDIHLSTFEPLREVFNDGEKARDFILKSTQLANLFNEGSRFLEMKKGGRISRIKGAEMIVAAVTDKILEQTNRRSGGLSLDFDLNDPDMLLSVIESAEVLADQDLIEAEPDEEFESSSVRAELSEQQPEIAEAGNAQILDEIVDQIASANTSLDELTQISDVSTAEFKMLASASQNILNDLGEESTNTVFSEEVDLLVQVNTSDSQLIIESAASVEALAEADSSSSEGTDAPFSSDDEVSSAFKFSLAELQQVSAERQINVYAPVLTTTEVVAPEELNDNLLIGSVSAYDPEGEAVIYSLVGENPDFDFDDTPMLLIDPETGQLKILDFDDLELMTEDILRPVLRVADPQGLFRDEQISLNIASWTYLAGRLQIPDLALSVPENLPVGTILHQFPSTDDKGGIIEYFLVAGEGSQDNGQFKMDLNGTLSTATVFDFESNQDPLRIRVQAVDNRNDSAENDFSIEVTDMRLPNVQTGPARMLDGLLHFDATVVHFDTPGEDMKLGFLIGRSSFLGGNSPMPEKIYADRITSSSFTLEHKPGEVGGAYYYAAFAESLEGMQYGLENSFVLPRITNGSEWLDGSEVETHSTWWQSPWFGLYNVESYPWIYHQNLGWVFVHTDSTKGAWLYHQRLGWLWTEPELFPYLYMSKRDQWTYVNRSTFRPTVYDFAKQVWFEPDRAIRVEVINSLAHGGEIIGSGTYYRWDSVSLEALPSKGFNFAGWSGDLHSMEKVISFEATQDLQIEASFIEIPSSNISSQALVTNLEEILNKMDHLTEAEKEKSLAELLISGHSPTSGISILPQD
jgi:hypothetical protein